MAKAPANNRSISKLIEGDTIIVLPGGVYGTEQDDNLSGTNETNYMYGYGGDDTLRGNGGNDYLDGGVGADLMIGGTGNDRYFVRDVDDRVVEWANSGDNDWVYAFVHNVIPADDFDDFNYYQLPDNVENVHLAGDALKVIGNDLDNEMVGNNGNNYLDGKAGADEMRGRQGNDHYFVDNVGDRVIEYANQGYDRVTTLIDYYLPDHVEAGRMEGDGDLKLFGNDLDNRLSGNRGDNVFNAGLGNNTVYGLTGHDILQVDTDNTGIHFFVIDNDSVSFERNIEFAGIEEIHIAGGNGATIIEAQNYTDGMVWLKGNGGNNRLTGTNNSDRLEGGSGNNYLNGLDGHDLLMSGSFNDTLSGGAGNDTLVGSDLDRASLNEVDHLTGGAGSDTFWLGTTERVFYETGLYAQHNDYAIITDFSQAEDKMRLHGQATDYQLDNVSMGSINGVGIYLDDASGQELIAIVRGDTAGLDLSANYFQYVD